MEITLPNSQGNQNFRSVAGKRSNGRAVYLGDPRLALLGRSPVGAEKSALTTPCPVAAGSVFSGKVQQFWNYSAIDPCIPNLFVCSGCIPRLERKLVLNEPATPFGKRIKGLVSGLHLGVRFEVLEETSTDRDIHRVFISQLIQPYPSFVPLTKFRNALNPVK